MPARYASVGVRGRYGLPSNVMSALVGHVDAGEQIDQRRLARAVLAEQHVRLAARDVERHVLQRHDPGEMLTDAPQLEKRAGHRVGSLRFDCGVLHRRVPLASGTRLLLADAAKSQARQPDQ